MISHYHSSLVKIELPNTLRTLNETLPGTDFGDKVCEKIAQRIKEIEDYLDSIKTRSNFFELVARKYKVAQKHPKVYYKDGHENCHNLFFEETFIPTVLGEKPVAWVRFYIPTMFTDAGQKKVMCSFTKDGEHKAGNIDCVEFYSAGAYYNPDREYR